MASLSRIKRYHDTIARQADELAAWNVELEDRVRAQVAELERLGRLRRFLSPQLADLVVASDDEALLASHRREIVVVFFDLRGFTAFAETSEPEEVMAVLREYHALLGRLVHAHDGTLERFTGDGVMVFFNDPLPCEDPAARAVRMAARGARGGARRGRAVGRPRARPRARHRDRAGLRDPGPDRLRGPLRLRRDRQRHEPGGAAVRRGRALAGAGQPAGARGRAEHEVDDVLVGDLQPRGFSRPVRVYDVREPDSDEVTT